MYQLITAITLNPNLTGKTLSAQLVDSSGADYLEPITTGFAEIGNGHYLFDYQFEDNFRGAVKIICENRIVALCSVNKEENNAEIFLNKDQFKADVSSLATKTDLTSTQNVLASSIAKLLSAVYESCTVSGNVITLSNGATLTINESGRTLNES